MRIFVTGGTGFIGSHLVKRLLEGQHELCCLVRPSSDIRFLVQAGVKLVEGDLLDRESLLSGMEGCEWVIHLASVYSFWEPDRSIYARVNVGGTRNLLESALETGVAKTIHVSTTLAYGEPDKAPFDETSQPGPVQFSEYARTKRAGELIAWHFHQDLGLPLVVVHPAAVTGAGDPHSSGGYIRDLMEGRMPILPLPQHSLTWVHVQDVVEGIARAAEQPDNLGQRYFLANRPLTNLSLTSLVCAIAQVPLPRVVIPAAAIAATARVLTWLADRTGRPPLWDLSPDYVRTARVGSIADGSKAARELGLCYTPIAQALREAIASYQKGGS